MKITVIILAFRRKTKDYLLIFRPSSTTKTTKVAIIGGSYSKKLFSPHLYKKIQGNNRSSIPQINQEKPNDFSDSNSRRSVTRYENCTVTSRFQFQLYFCQKRQKIKDLD